MISGIGIDIVEISRVKAILDKKSAFVGRVFTEKERKYFEQCNLRPEVLAGNFAAKEAVVKAMGTGFRDIKWQDVEVLRDALGKPYVILHNNAKNIVARRSLIHISISHSREYAVANAVIEAWDGNDVYDYGCAIAEEKGL